MVETTRRLVRFCVVGLGFCSSSWLSGLDRRSRTHGALHAVSGVKTIHFVAGPTFLIDFVEAADQTALMEALGKLRAVKGVASTDTRIVMPT